MNKYKIEYKKQAPIHIWTFDCIEKYNKESEGYYSDLDFDTDYYKIYGEFFYCGLVVDGILFLTESELNEINEKSETTFSFMEKINSGLLEFTKSQIDIIRIMEFEAKHIGTIYEDEDDPDSDDIFLFMRI